MFPAALYATLDAEALVLLNRLEMSQVAYILVSHDEVLPNQ